MKKRVLVVAGDAAIRARVARLLQPAGYAVELADGKKRACALIDAGKIDAAIIAHSSLGAQGQDLADELSGLIGRVIVLAETGQQVVRGAGSRPDLKRQAPPFTSYEQLLARLSDLLSPVVGTAGELPAAGFLRFADRTIDLAGRTLHDPAGREVPLTHAEFDLLATFVRRAGRVLSRDHLRNAVAGRGNEPDERSIDMLVARLRRKIEPDPKNPQFILTVPGEGYKFPLRTQRADSAVAILPDSPVPAPPQVPLSRFERRQMTVLACQVGGLRSPDPEDLQFVVARMHQVMKEVTERFGGQLVVGTPADRVFVYFGYPHSQEDDAELAVRAAVELIRAMPSAGSGLGDRPYVRIGAASGIMLVSGPSGSESFSATGEPLNLAVELRSVASPGAVIVADGTRSLCGSFFDYEEIEPVVLDEGSAPVRVWQVISEASAGRFDALHRAGMVTLVDRDEQLDLLLRRWEKAKTGSGQIVMLTGEPGIGKSRLAVEFQNRISAEAHSCLEYFGLPHQTDASMSAVIRELERASGFIPADESMQKLRKLEGLLQAAGATAPENVLLTANLLSLSTASLEDVAQLAPKERKERTFAALFSRINGLVADRPVLAIVEDAQWIDPTSLEFLTILGERLSTLPILMVLTARPKFALPWPDHPYVTTIELPRLARSDAEQLLERVAGAALPRELADRILMPAEGVPLFVEELTKAALEAGAWHDGQDRHESDVECVQTIPSTLQGSLIARLDRLGAVTEFAQIGAVIGREFSYELLRSVARMDEPALRSALDQIAASELVFRRGVPPLATYIFKHALVRDAAYGMLSRPKKQELHSAVARALEEGFPETIEIQPELLAYHYREAGNVVKEARYLTDAAERALSRSALSEADRQIARGLELIASLPNDDTRWRLELRLKMARARRVIEDKGYAHEQAGDAFREALALSNRIGDEKTQLDALYGLWAHHYIRGEPGVMLTRANEFWAAAERQNESGPKVVGRRLVGTSLLITGATGEAVDALRQALAHYDPKEHGPASPVGRALTRRFVQDLGVTVESYLSWALWLTGKPDEATQHAKAVEERGRAAKRSGHTLSLLYALFHAGMAYILLRDLPEVERLGHELTDLAGGRPYWLALGDFLLGWHARQSGRPVDAVQALKCGLYERWEKTGSRIFRPIFLAFLADAYAANNDLELAKRTFAQALEIVAKTEERWAEPEIHRLIGDLDAREDLDLPILRYKQAIKVAHDQGSLSFELRAATSLARALSDRGRRAQAADCLSGIYKRFKEGFDTPDLLDANALLVRLQSASQQGGH